MQSKNHGNISGRHSWVVIIIIALVLFPAACVPGCLKILSQQDGTRQVPDTYPSITPAAGPGNKSAPAPAPEPVTVSPSPAQGVPPWLARYGHNTGSAAPAPTPVPDTLVSSSRSPPDLVTSDQPVLVPDPYPVQHAVRIPASTAEPLHHARLAEFKQTYVLRGNSTGMVINATRLEGPLWIYFDVKPLYDCIETPESCRGRVDKVINRPYFTLTIRDYPDGGIVAMDGYGQEYSSQKTNRTIKIYDEGRYHLTLAGSSVDVTLAVSTGAAPDVPGPKIIDILSATDTAASAHPSTGQMDILRKIRGGG